MAGWFVALEGPEGSGKSTQARLLAELLRNLGQPVVLTREPGGTAIGEQIRNVLLDQGNCAMLAQTEALLLAAARAQHVGEVIRPALSTGAVVVCDRFIDSTLAYQGGGHGLPLDQLLAIQTLATNELRPDLRLLFDLPVDVGLARRLQAQDGVNRIDRAAVEFHERVRTTYLALARADPDGWVIIDASMPIVDVADQVREAVMERRQRPAARND